MKLAELGLDTFTTYLTRNMRAWRLEWSARGNLLGIMGFRPGTRRGCELRRSSPEYFAHTWTPLANGVEGAWTRVGDMYVTIKKPGHRWIAVFEPIGPGRKHSYAPGGRSLESTAQKALVFLKGR